VQAQVQVQVQVHVQVQVQVQAQVQAQVHTMENESKCNKKSVWEGSGTNKTNIRYYYETATAPE
jgi:hypothetical protein